MSLLTESEIASHVPTNEVIDGKLYCDGIHVFESQLTEAELREYFPERYVEEDKKSAGVACPMCADIVDSKDKRGLSMHYRNNHPEEYKQHSELFSDSDLDPTGLAEKLKEVQNATH